MSLNITTGEITPSSSAPGIYDVFYTMPGCPSVTETTSIEIVASSNASISYAGPYTTAVSAPQSVSLIGNIGGTYSATPSGLNLDSLTGDIIPSLSAVGSYLVTYTINGAGPCSNYTTNTTVQIIATSGICSANGNVMLYSNYEGGVLNINVDQNIPNLKIGICSYEATEVNFTGAFVGNISEVIYAGFNGLNNANCSGNIPTTIINGVAQSIVSIFSSTTGNIAPTTYLGEITTPNTIPLVNCMVGAANCSNSNGGGGNSSPQIVQYFLNAFGPGAQLFAHLTQYACFSGNYLISAGGNCCLQNPTTPPNPIYSSPDNYNFIIPNDTVLCSDSITFDLSFYPVLFQPPTYPGYVWSDGTQGPIIHITQPGTYSFTVGDYCHYGSNLLTDTIVVLPCCNQPPAPIVSSNVSYCLGEVINPISASPQTGGLITWYSDINLLNIIGQGTNFTPTLNIGNNNFYVTETNAGCEGPYATIEIILNTIQSASINYPFNQVCQFGANITPTITGTQGGAFSAIPSGVFFNGTFGEIDLQNSIPGNYSIIYATIGNCNDADTFNITIQAAQNGGFTYSDFFFCNNAPDPSAIIDIGANFGIFSANSTNLVFSNSANGTIDLAATIPGIYTITNTIPASGACSAYIGSFTLTVTEAPSANIVYQNSNNCAGSKEVLFPILTGTTGGKYYSSSNSIALDSINGSINLNNTLPGNYSIIYKIPAANGCLQFDTNAIVTVKPGPQVNISSSVTINQFQTATIIATGTGVFNWENGEINDTIIVAPKESSTFCVTANYNSCLDTACTMVYVEVDCGDIYIPNAFSPNGDASNDLQCVLGNCIEDMTFVIYDRWGEKIFETNNQNSCWDGTFKGNPCFNGVYVYRFEATLKNKEFITKQGNINLIR